MEITFFDEPELDFGAGKHIDIRFGLKNYGPLDFASSLAPKQIKLGIVGTNQTIQGVASWLDKCRSGIPAKASKQPNLFPSFPGFTPETSFRAGLVFDSRLQRTILPVEFERFRAYGSPNEIVVEAAQLFFAELQYLTQNTQADVLLVCLPDALLDAMNPEPRAEEEEETSETAMALDFHHLLKARCMELPKPIQIVLPTTYSAKQRRGRRRPERLLAKQDDATRAWNLLTAIYYKAGGIPWRMIRDATQLTTCYVGVGFYETLDRSKLLTSIAQVFNERGEGVIVRGGTAEVSKEDRQPHLSGENAFALLSDALERYRDEHKNLPARVVLHKTSKYTDGERDGFLQACRSKRVEAIDLLMVDRSFTRLFRIGVYPTLRGTFWTLDEKAHRLYTRGSVDFFATYPGMYVPRSLELWCDTIEQTPTFLGQEILALTKMNWNNTQFDGASPITVRAARQVGRILKYVGEGGRVQPRYSFYM